jgi:hypothetical protein
MSQFSQFIKNEILVDEPRRPIFDRTTEKAG